MAVTPKKKSLLFLNKNDKYKPNCGIMRKDKENTVQLQCDYVPL